VSIFVAHQGLGLDGQLYYNTFAGETWAAYQQVPNVGTSGSPSAVTEGAHVNA
jgi:hypothetical protein